MALIDCKNVSLAYESLIVAENVSFQVNPGDYLCVIGENGSGKSTLIRALLGLKNVSAGRIAYGDGLRADEIGYLPQQTQTQRDFPASVREVVRSGFAGKHLFYGAAQAQRAERNMQLLGIGALSGRCYRELSGGQQQRALLARALCATERLLLLDEPVSGLDPIAKNELYELIARLNRERGITVIMVTHDLEPALQYATHILHLHKKTAFFSEKSDYLQCEQCRGLMEGFLHDYGH